MPTTTRTRRLFAAGAIVAATGAPLAFAAPAAAADSPPVVGSTALVASDANPATSESLVIRAFRTNGPGGSQDEFVEVYNNSSAPAQTPGFSLIDSDSDGTRHTIVSSATFPTTIGAHQRVLFVNTASSASQCSTTSGSIPFDQPADISDNGGVGIVETDGNTIADQVGLTGGDTSLGEGGRLAPRAFGEQAYQRKGPDGNQDFQDTNDNRQDFVLTSPTPCSQPAPNLPEVPYAVLLPLLGLGIAGTIGLRRAVPRWTRSS